MNERLPQDDLEMLSIELLDDASCQGLIGPLNELENLVFGPDFACSTAQVQPWFDSGCLIYSAVAGEAVAGQQRILSALSVFITTAASRDRMLLGEIADIEMIPWTLGDADQPTIYLSSVVSVAPHHLAAMYNCLLRDVLRFRDAHGLSFHGGFAIATGVAGRRHMARSGFRLLEGHKYRGRYDLMVIDSLTAATPFWTGLLRDDTTFLSRADASRGVAASALPAESQPPADEGGARETEKRLAMAKTNRLRERMDF
jgi:hypothetical protein